MSEQSSTRVEWFQASGRAMAIFLLVAWALIAVICVLGGADPALYGGLLILAVLTHVTLLRPRVGTSRDDLILRELYSEFALPLADIESMEIGRYFEASVSGRRYISPAIARSRRNRRRAEEERDPRTIYADLVEDTVRARIADARARTRPGTPPGAVRRTWAPAEIGITVAAVIVTVVLLII
jgi:hypothetical protein